MDNSTISSGPIPEQLDERLVRRDKEPLPAGALLKFQLINRGKSPDVNYRWLLYEDGRWFLARHSGDTSGDWQTPFDTDYPAEPTKVLPRKEVEKIRQQLKQANFLAQEPYHLDRGVRDGGYRVVTARLDGRVHEVIYAAVANPLAEYLENVAYEQDC